MLRDKVIASLKESLDGFDTIGIDVEKSVSRGKFGDYSTNIIFSLNKVNLGSNVVDTAKKIIAKLEKNELFEKVEFSPPAFINFYLSAKIWQSEVQKIVENRESYSHLETNSGKKARVEFVSANPTGPLHIGNARGGPLGDVIAAVLEESGYEVLREYLHNDIGGQVEKLGESLINFKKGLKLAEQEYKGEYLRELIKEMPDSIGDSHEAGVWAVGHLLKEILGEIEQIGIKYDKVYKESEFAAGPTKEILEKLKGSGKLKEKDGATWLATSDEFLKDKEAVVIKSNGQLTYFANDIAYHNLKFGEGYDLIIDELGSGHDGHIPKLKSAITALGYDLNKFKVVVHQNVRVKVGDEVVKLSKRVGSILTAKEVLDEVGKDAFRFFMLQKAPETHMDFDLELAKKASAENPVYYVQYAHTRMANILNKSKDIKADQKRLDLTLLKEEAELALIKKLSLLPELVADLSENLAVHQLTTYAIDLADSFHHFYEKVRVIGDDADLTNARLNLVLAAKIVLGRTLLLLGVTAPERM